MADDNSLRGETVVETIRNVVEQNFGEDVEVPDDLISVILVLATQMSESKKS